MKLGGKKRFDNAINPRTLNIPKTYLLPSLMSKSPRDAMTSSFSSIKVSSISMNFSMDEEPPTRESLGYFL
jgi:hypothetical protein